MQTCSGNRNGANSLSTYYIPDIVLKDKKLKRWNFVRCPPEANSAVR